MDQSNADRAEKVQRFLIQGGFMASLPRRFVRFDEVPEWLWQADVEKQAAYRQAVFKEELNNLIHEGNMISWEEFEETVLPKAIALHFIPLNRLYDIGCLTTLMDGHAKPITIWDDPEKRNPFTTWIPQQMAHHRGSASYKWKINLGQEHPIHAITYPGYSFGSDERKKDLIRLMVFREAMLIPNCKGIGLFESELILELKEVWPEIKAFAASAQLANPQDAFVCLANATHLEFELIVTTETQRTRYVIDRYRHDDPSMSALEKTRLQNEAKRAAE